MYEYPERMLQVTVARTGSWPCDRQGWRPADYGRGEIPHAATIPCGVVVNLWMDRLFFFGWGADWRPSPFSEKGVAPLLESFFLCEGVFERGLGRDSAFRGGLGDEGVQEL